MRLLQVFWRLLRYRVAVMLLLFMLLGAALHARVTGHSGALLLGALALAFSYVSATSSNDIADEEIDRINHRESPGRPLINGAASRTEIWQLFALASSLAILSAAVLGWRAAGLLTLSVALNVGYSLPPLRLSYRTFLAPLVLGVAYVGVPYLLGVVCVKGALTSRDGWWLLGLYLMFVGRISLKDFRDRAGDARYHKPTFLLRFGKQANCLASGVCIAAGGLIILSLVRSVPFLAVLCTLYLASILLMLLWLRRSPAGPAEQLSIGVGAKMGNGLLITLLTYYLLSQSQASFAAQILITWLIAAAFFANFVAFWSAPDKAVIGYRG